MEPNHPSAQEKARELRARLLAGEKIPNEELISFILSSNSQLEKQRKSVDTKPTDVDFF